MKKICSCGFIIAEVKYGFPTGWLLCHPTNGGDRWDIPKGLADGDENHFEAAVRELYEETGLVLLLGDDKVIDLGQHSYQDKKDLHLFYMEVADINTKVMHCESMVENKKGPNFPEMDAFAVFEIEKVSHKIGNGLNAWINSHVPASLLAGWTLRA